MKADFRQAVRQICVRDVMQMHMVTVVPEMTVRELAHTLLESGVRSAPVLDPAGKVLGVASQADVTRLAFGPPAGQPGATGGGDRGTDGLRVRDVMRPAGLTVAPDEPLPGLIRHFLACKDGQVLVVQHGILLGVVTPMDVLRAIHVSL
jgi:predicted transcriptional regulator